MHLKRKIIVKWLFEGTGEPEPPVPLNIEIEVYSKEILFSSNDTNKRMLLYWRANETTFVEFQQRSSSFQETFIVYWGKCADLEKELYEIDKASCYYDIQSGLDFAYDNKMCFADLEIVDFL